MNHYRFGKNLSDLVKFKISNSFKERKKYEIEKTNHVLEAYKKSLLF